MQLASHDHLAFRIDSLTLGVLLTAVSRVLPAQALTMLPGAPAHVQGVIDVGGEIVPVYDARSRFGLAPRAQALGDVLLLLQTSTRTVCLPADQVCGIVALVESDIVGVADAVPGAEHIAGVASLPDGLLLVHDLERFLTPAAQQQLAVALADRPGER